MALLRSLVAAACIAATAPAAAQEISAARLRTHLTYLASDRTEGRKPGTPGYDLAARYVADQFAQMKLKPPRGSWFQTTPFSERRVLASPPMTLTIAGTRFQAPATLAGSLTGEGPQHWEGEAVFVGEGAITGRNAYGGISVRGKAVAMFEGPAMLERLRFAQQQGAAGVIVIRDAREQADYPWSAAQADHGAATIGWMNPDGTPHREVPGLGFVVTLDKAAGDALFAGAPRSHAELTAGRIDTAFPLKPRIALEGSTEWRRFTSANVIGLLPGSDPALAGEVVVLIAHLDHVGMDPALPGTDKIFNGALDNASGVAALIEVARTMAAARTRPRRPLLFVAATAEEMQLLGSDYLARHPVTGGRVVAVVNLDGGVPLHPLARVSAMGGAHSTLGPIFEAQARKHGLAVMPDPIDSYFDRSDHFSFARQGIPALYLVSREATQSPAMKRYFESQYHQPGDDLSLPFDWQSGAAFAGLARDLLRAIADAPQPPLWYADSPFAARYAPGAAKAARH